MHIEVINRYDSTLVSAAVSSRFAHVASTHPQCNKRISRLGFTTLLYYKRVDLRERIDSHAL